MNVQSFLERNHIAYETIPHRRTGSAQQLAQAVEETGHHVAKAVLLKSGANYLLAVIPATHVVDESGTRQLLRDDSLELASEEEVTQLFQDCEAGAVLPFGSWYGLTTLVDESLSEIEEIVFDGNTHDEAIRMRFADYFELEKPVLTHLSYPENS